MLCQLKILARQFVEIRRRGIAAVKGHIRPPQVIGDDKDKVRLRRIGFSLWDQSERSDDGDESANETFHACNAYPQPERSARSDLN